MTATSGIVAVRPACAASLLTMPYDAEYDHGMRNAFIDAIERIRRNKLPVVLYGAATLAERIYAYLDQNAVTVSAVAVDAKFLAKRPTFAGHTVVSLESLLSENRRYNYIVAFGAPSPQAVRAKLEPAAAEIVICDAGYGAVEDIGGQIAYYSSYATVNKDRLECVLASLEDARSRETLAAFVAQKISGVFGEYERLYCDNQYFPDELFPLRENEIFVDCGAYDGDTITAFQRKLTRDGISGYKAIYAFEPEPASYARLAAATAHYPHCTIFQKGLWHQADRLAYKSHDKSSGITQSGDKHIDVVTLDAVLPEEGCTFIKMDIECAELRALQGARQTIARHKPILAVSLYHKPEDIVTIPVFIKTLVPEYRLYIRAHHKTKTTEMVLYAVPPLREK